MFKSCLENPNLYLNNNYSKDDTGTTDAIKEMLKCNKNKEYKEKLKLVANTFLTNRQIGNNLQLNKNKARLYYYIFMSPQSNYVITQDI